MRTRHSPNVTGTPDEFIEEVLHSNAFAGAHPFTYHDRHGQECQVLIFAVKMPMTLKKLTDMMHVMVESVEFYELWEGGRRPSANEILAVSPEE